ncbi:MAG: GDP-L-fucose synthase [Gammaproteobacteria bacterium]
MIEKDARIFLAGHRGMVGSALLRLLQAEGYVNIVVRSRAELDLTDQAGVRDFMQAERPELVVLAAAKVGGIYANNEYPAEFIYENLMIEANVIHQAWVAGCPRLLFLGSSCIYPRETGQPMSEDALLTGTLEPTNEPYAVAKIAGIKLCESYNRQYGADFRSVMPTNLYGPGDNFHPQNSHVIPGLIRRFHEAKTEGSPFVTVWGSGIARREFLHVDDMAAACLHVVNLDAAVYGSVTEPMHSHLNIGCGEDMSIRDLAETVRRVVGYPGEIRWDAGKPDGTLRKLLNVDKLKALGWQPRIGLNEGLAETYRWFLEHREKFRGN